MAVDGHACLRDARSGADADERGSAPSWARAVDPRMPAAPHRLADSMSDHAQMILDNAGDAYIAIDTDGIVIEWNRAAERMYGYSHDEAVGSFMPDLIMPTEYRHDHDVGIERYKSTGHGVVSEQFVELEAIRKGGERFPIEMAFWGMQHDGRWQFYSFARDITERKTREAELDRRARYDEATGLKNRAALVESMTEIIDALSAEGGRAAVLLIEVERFTALRDSLGHRVTEQIIATVADRLRARFGASAEVARIAESDFVIVDPSLADMSAATGKATSIVEALRAPMTLSGDEATISVVVGGMIIDGSMSADAALRNVSAGLHESRADGAPIVVVDDEVLARVRRRARIESDLAVGIDGGQLRAYFQPIVEMGSGRVVAAESLVRWQHPDGELLAPGAFIDVAEESGLIVALGSWMVREASAQLGRWLASGFHGFQVGVNLSARQFVQADLLGEVAAAKRAAGLDALGGTLVLEVTETLMMNDPERAAAILASLKGLGVEIALDDFGTGYSSMAYLKTFPVDVIKIDRSFVSGIDADPRNEAIVRAVTDLGHGLGLAVLAEGIETEGEREVLARIGCDLAQGYLFGRPTPAEGLTALLESQAWAEQCAPR